MTTSATGVRLLIWQSTIFYPVFTPNFFPSLSLLSDRVQAFQDSKYVLEAFEEFGILINIQLYQPALAVLLG